MYKGHSIMQAFFKCQASMTGLLSNKHIDFYKDETKLLNGKTIVDAKRSGVIMSASPENQGELCPPPAKCDTQGATLIQQ